MRLTMRSQYSNRTVVVDAIEVPDICLDVLAVPSDEIAVPIKEFCLADARVGGHDPEGGISILIGADSYWEFATEEHKRITEKLTAIDTVLGWTIQGPSFVNATIATQNNFASLNVCICEDVRSFWQLETLGILPNTSKGVSKDLMMCLRRSGDRYEALLPWKKTSSILHNNFSGAMHRLKSLVRRLRSNGRLLEYDEAINEMLSNDVAESAPEMIGDQERAYKCRIAQFIGKIKRRRSYASYLMLQRMLRIISLSTIISKWVIICCRTF